MWISHDLENAPSVKLMSLEMVDSSLTGMRQNATYKYD